MPHRHQLEPAADILRRSGEIVREHWSKPRNVRFKGPKDLVTETDVAVEAFLRAELGALLPAAGFLGEEGSGNLAVSGLQWVVDPVDGTTNFAHGIPFVATSVALCLDGEPLLGLVNLPILGELFCAARGLGATLNGEAIHVSPEPTLMGSVVATGFPYAIGDYMAEILGQLERVLPLTQGVRRAGAAALDLAFVACGRYEAFFEFALNPWDTAAGVLLVTEAGGRVGRFDLGGGPYTLGDRTILASNGHVHEPLRSALAPRG